VLVCSANGVNVYQGCVVVWLMGELRAQYAEHSNCASHVTRQWTAIASVVNDASASSCSSEVADIACVLRLSVSSYP
jgi:hypothetical protein